MDFVWAYSIAIDGGTKGNVPYLDVRLRLVILGELHNLHLVALPMYESHTGENMFLLISKFMDGLSPNWKNKLISVASDGASSMHGRVQGVLTRLDEVCLKGFYRIWCGSHQLELVVKAAFSRMLNGTFVDQTHRITGYLRRQINLKSEMKTQCPKLVSTRWLSMERLLLWLVKHRVAVEQFMFRKNPPCKPNIDWWIMVHVIKDFTTTVNIVSRKLQGQTTLVAEQDKLLKKLVEDLCDDGKVNLTTTIGAIDCPPAGRYINGLYFADIGNAEEVIQNSDLFVLTSMEGLRESDPNTYLNILQGIIVLYVNSVNGINSISIDRDHMNRPTQNLPSVRPKDLLLTSRATFNELLLLQKERLLHSISEMALVELEDEYKAFKMKIRNDTSFLLIIEGMDDMISFDDAWARVGMTESQLCHFFGGLATVFPGTSTVESDFSDIGYEKDDYRTSLTNLSLEGILQCKQFKKLSDLRSKLDIHKNKQKVTTNIKYTHIQSCQCHHVAKN